MENLSEEEVRNLLREGEYGHLGLCQDGNAYVIPMWYGYAGNVLYFQGSHGLKSEFIESTGRACFSFDLVRSTDDWVSVLAYGPIEAVTDDGERLVAMDALMERPNPPAGDGPDATLDQPEEYYKLTLEEVTGRISHRASEPPEEDLEVIGA